jgi:uncharacterized protein YqeY
MKNDLLNLIKKAMLSKNQIELDTLRGIKTKFTEFETGKGAPVLTEAEEIRILNKMLKERVETAEIYSTNGRPELAEKELAEAAVISAFLPKEATREEIEKYVDTLGVFTQKDMGQIIAKVKAQFTNADGKTVADIVKSKL